jgi:DNA-binding LacI/PurR family transcriptional regulator
VEILLRQASRDKSQVPEHRLFDVHLVERESCSEPAV